MGGGGGKTGKGVTGDPVKLWFFQRDGPPVYKFLWRVRIKVWTLTEDQYLRINREGHQWKHCKRRQSRMRKEQHPRHHRRGQGFLKEGVVTVLTRQWLHIGSESWRILYMHKAMRSHNETFSWVMDVESKWQQVKWLNVETHKGDESFKNFSLEKKEGEKRVSWGKMGLGRNTFCFVFLKQWRTLEHVGWMKGKEE